MADNAPIKLSELKVGDIITIKDGAPIYHTNDKFASWVYGYKFTIIQVGKSTDKEYIVFGINGQVTGAIQYQYIATRNGKGGVTKPNTKKNDKPNKGKTNNAVPTKDDKEKAADKSKTDGVSKPPKPSAKSSTSTTGATVQGTTGDIGTAGGATENQSAMPITSAPANRPIGSSTTDVATEIAPVNPSTPTTGKKGNTRDAVGFIRASGKAYPTPRGYDNSSKRFIYDYYTTIAEASSRLSNIRDKHNIFTTARSNAYYYDSHFYNRFKIPNPNNALSASFAHVFFVRPDLNILQRVSRTTATGSKFDLPDGAKNDPDIVVSWRNNPDMVKQLILDNGMNHLFMLSLSNAAGSFSLGDEGLKTDTAGETWTGHKIAYGKQNIEGKTAGQITISYTDNRNLDIYHINKIWMDYISKVYRGELEPRSSVYDAKRAMYMDSANGMDGKMYSYEGDKILDYATAVYYILTAEDGETIIFWSKYFGVFPVNAPSSNFSWSQGNRIHNPSYDIQYMYSFKRDYNPFDLVAFNMLSPIPKNGKYTYVNTYDPEMLGPGRTLVGVPFIETVKSTSKKSENFQFKLRFRTRTSLRYTPDA